MDTTSPSCIVRSQRSSIALTSIVCFLRLQPAQMCVRRLRTLKPTAHVELHANSALSYNVVYVNSIGIAAAQLRPLPGVIAGR